MSRESGKGPQFSLDLQDLDTSEDYRTVILGLSDASS